MIAVDTSALVAIIQREADSERCEHLIENADQLLISAATVVEATIVARRRGFDEQMGILINRLAFEVVAVTAETAGRIASVYDLWGKGVHPAGLNIIDCFAYDVAKSHNCPLLYVGNDFAQTDVEAAI